MEQTHGSKVVDQFSAQDDGLSIDVLEKLLREGFKAVNDFALELCFDYQPLTDARTLCVAVSNVAE